MITATNESEVIDISPYPPLVREKYFIVPQLLIPGFVAQSILEINLESPQTPNIIVASDHKYWADIQFPEILRLTSFWKLFLRYLK